MIFTSCKLHLMAISGLRTVALLFLLTWAVVKAQSIAQIPIRFEANSTSDCHEACASLVNILGEKVHYQELSADLFEDYFSARQQEATPLCLVLPTSAEDVSDAFKVVSHHQCTFAAKSGGHAMFPGASSAPGGITFDLRYLNGLGVSEDLSTAFVGTGNRWADVYGYLGLMNLTAIGGRDSAVGVGGFLLGGGISYMSRRHGWGADNVRNYELVLANGSISNISYGSHPDLYWALRGGGSNFGIVTRFDLETYPHHPMWGDFNAVLLSDIEERLSFLGLSRTFSWTPSYFLEQGMLLANRLACRFGYCTTLDAFAETLWKLSIDTKEDPYAQVYGFLTMFSYAHIYSVGYHMVHGGALDNTPAYSAIRKMKKVYSSSRTADITSFAKELTALNPKGYRLSYSTATFKPSLDLLKEIINIFISEVEPIRELKGVFVGFPLMFITKDEASHFSKNGGNPLGIVEDDCPLILINAAFRWNSKDHDKAVLRASKNIIDRSVATAKEMGLAHRFLYQNYASGDQDVFAGYGRENRERLREIQKKYDPESVFPRLQAGYFKV